MSTVHLNPDVIDWLCRHSVNTNSTSVLATRLQSYSCLISNLMHKILIYLHIIPLLKSSTCFEQYPAHLQEVYIAIVYMQPLVSSLSAESDDTRGCIYTITT